MKKNIALIAFLILTLGLSLTVSSQDATTQLTETEFKVLGLCGMCKNRIEKAALSVRGVRTANWDQQKQVLKVNYRSDRANQEQIERAVAKAGHDTENFITDEKTHANLHHCCKYPRDPQMLQNNKLHNQ